MDELETTTPDDMGEISDVQSPTEPSEPPTGDAPIEATESDASTDAAPTAATTPIKRKKKGPSGAYWYTVKEDAELIKNSQIRSLVHVIALMLQLVILALPQVGLEYVTIFIPSYAFVYMWAVFIMIGVSIYVIIMDFTRNKLKKRIPVERAPKNGFKRRAFLTAELFIAVHALIFVLEFSFMCISFDGVGLLGMFLALAATGMAVWARIIEWRTLKDAELIPPPETDDSGTA